jgi:hypothetical protein
VCTSLSRITWALPWGVIQPLFVAQKAIVPAFPNALRPGEIEVVRLAALVIFRVCGVVREGALVRRDILHCIDWPCRVRCKYCLFCIIRSVCYIRCMVLFVCVVGEGVRCAEGRPGDGISRGGRGAESAIAPGGATAGSKWSLCRRIAAATVGTAAMFESWMWR